MRDHPFLFSPKQWLGEGNLHLSASDEKIPFSTRWDLQARDSQGNISAFQEVEIKAVPDPMHNQFLITSLQTNQFEIELENATLGMIKGKGLIRDTLIAWEFRDLDLGFEGFEFYEIQQDGSYLMRAEYVTADQMRTNIKGKIWEKG